MIWSVILVFGCSMCLAHSIPGYHHPPGSSSVWGYFTPPLIHRPPSRSQETAMKTMVDVTNNLGVAILRDHSYSRSNFAFSPYGVASVLVVLYEGARGESARQIHTAVGFPTEKEVIRVGFRDIHLHLKSYFSHEGYLSGISLNKKNSSLKPVYKKILRFYGYDVDPSQSSEDDDKKLAFENSTIKPKEPEAFSPITQVPIQSSAPNIEKDKGVTEPHLDKKTHATTVKLKNGTEKPQKITAVTLADTSEPSHRVEKEPKKTTTVTPEFTSEIPQGMQEKPRKTTMVSSTVTQEPFQGITTTTEFQNEAMGVTSIELSENNDEFNMNLTVEQNPVSHDSGVSSNEKQNEEFIKEDKVEEKNTSTDFDASVWEGEETSLNPETEVKITEKTNTDLDNGMLIPQLDDPETTPKSEFTTTTELERTSLFTTEVATQSFEDSSKSGRTRKSSLKETEMRTKNEIRMSSDTILNEKHFSNRIRSIINTKVPLWLGDKAKKSRIRRTLTDYLKSPDSPDLSLQLQNGMYDSHISRNADLYRSLPRLLFLVDGVVDTPVPMMSYTNVFPYAYIPRLHAKALELPLDDIRYKLLILLPVERRGLRQLIYDLGDFPLRNVLDVIRPARVRATVPTFMVEGFVILTSSLQKLGIWDVFDPRKANLSGMSWDPELFVRNVEQSVTVVIRNYVEILDIQTRAMAARNMEYEFEASHPFLYFVLDTATNAALMAGQILDPLNSRIY